MIKLSVIDAAKIMKKDPQFIRKGLRTGRLPFGSAIYVHKKRYSYYISPIKFANYLGITEERLKELINA